MSWSGYIKRWLYHKPAQVELHELHRWHSITDTCGYCGGTHGNGRHLKPSHRPLTIYDVTFPATPGSLMAIVAAACCVDANACVYQAEGYPGVVFIELMDAALYHHASAEVWLRKTIGVLVIFVGLGRLESERYEK